MTETVIIVGGGVAGLTAAHELIERGFEVHLYERRSFYGGKAASQRDGTGDPARPNETGRPKEHGFRFYPGWYRHLPDTLSRIRYRGPRAYQEARTVLDNLVPIEREMLTWYDRDAITLPTHVPRSFSQARTTGTFVGEFAKLGLAPGELTFFAHRMAQFLMTPDVRRAELFEHMTWWNYLEADSKSQAYQELILATTRLMVAAKAKDASAYSIGRLALRTFTDALATIDRVMDGPTNEMWIDPWIDQLKGLGVKFHPGWELDRVEFADPPPNSLQSPSLTNIVAVHFSRAVFQELQRVKALVENVAKYLQRIGTTWPDVEPQDAVEIKRSITECHSLAQAILADSWWQEHADPLNAIPSILNADSRLQALKGLLGSTDVAGAATAAARAATAAAQAASAAFKATAVAATDAAAAQPSAGGAAANAAAVAKANASAAAAAARAVAGAVAAAVAAAAALAAADAAAKAARAIAAPAMAAGLPPAPPPPVVANALAAAGSATTAAAAAAVVPPTKASIKTATEDAAAATTFANVSVDEFQKAAAVLDAALDDVYASSDPAFASARREEGRYFIFALPVEQMAYYVNRDAAMTLHDPSLRNIVLLSEYTDWMAGIQFYLNEPFDYVAGHIVCMDSQWSLTAIEHTQFWRDINLRVKFAPGSKRQVDLRAVVSVDIAAWDKKGRFVRLEAFNCTTDEIATEVWNELKASVNRRDGVQWLRDDMLVGGPQLQKGVNYHLDDAVADVYDRKKQAAYENARSVEFSSEALVKRQREAGVASQAPYMWGAHREFNAEPLLINRVGSLALRPEAKTGIPNMFLAADYVRTETDLACMEGANEAARRAVNALLDAASSHRDRCQIWSLSIARDVLEQLTALGSGGAVRGVAERAAKAAGQVTDGLAGVASQIFENLRAMRKPNGRS